VTTPVDVTVATPILLLIQVPPDGEAVSVVVVPTQSELAPLIEPPVDTVTVRVTVHPPVV